MDGCDSLGTSTSEDVAISYESHADPPDSCEIDMKNLCVNDPGSCLTESLKVTNDQNSTRGFTTTPKNNGSICLVNEDESNDCRGTKMGNSAFKKCFDNCANFPYSGKAASSAGSINVKEKREVESTAEVLTPNGQANSANQPYLHSISLPTPLKLVSAMKGSREKQGKPAQKLSVTWAPDVYDPTPTAVSHVPSNKAHRHRSEGKKNRKNKQKDGGKSSRGSKGKDKKQARKSSRSSNRCDRSLDNGMLVSSSEPLASIANFDVGSPDQFCGSSFLKNSVSKLHFSVAEAS